MRHLVLGKMGERHAARFLRKQGFVILATNYRTPVGEIDIVAREKDIYCFVEVKTRSSSAYGLPQEAVDYRKQRKLIRVAEFYLCHLGSPDISCRFDVVSVSLGKAGRSREVQLIRNAFDASPV